MLGDNIKKYRQEARISQADLADRLYVTRQAVSNWERGISEPDVDMLLRLSKELYISIEDLIGDEEIQKEDFSRKTTRMLLAFQVLLTLLTIILRFSTGYIQNIGILIMLSFYPFMSVTLYLIFGYMYKSGDFSLLSGYDSRMHYDFNQLKRALSAQETWINFINALHMSLLLLIIISGTDENRAYIVLMLTYLISTIAGILKIEDAYRNKVYTKEIDCLKAKHKMKLSYLSLAAVFLPILILIAVELIELETVGADNIGILGLILLTSLPLPMIFIENDRIHSLVEAREEYRLGKFSAVILLACLVGNVIFAWHLFGF